jgi:hypothetical protein
MPSDRPAKPADEVHIIHVEEGEASGTVVIRPGEPRAEPNGGISIGIDVGTMITPPAASRPETPDRD